MAANGKNCRKIDMVKYINLAAAVLLLIGCSFGKNDASRKEAIGNETQGEPVEIRKQG